MSATEKLLLIGGLVRNIYGQWQLRQFLSGVLILAGLTLVTAILICTMLIGGFYAAYLALLYYGVKPYTTLFFIGCLFTLITLLFVTTTMYCLRRLGNMPGQWFKRSGAVAQAGETVDAFFNGLMQEDAR